MAVLSMVRHKTKKNIRKRASKKKQKSILDQKLDRKKGKNPFKPEQNKTDGVWPVWILFLTMIAVVSGLYLFYIKKLDSRNSDARQSIEETVKNRIERLTQDYPKGFKIITFENQKIVESKTDTLPKGFRINWNKVVLLRVSPEQKRDNPTSVKIQLPEISYEAYGISNLTLTQTFSMRKGAVVVLNRFGKETLFLEVLDATENRFICLFGLR